MTAAKSQSRIRRPSALADDDPMPRLFTGREYRTMADAGILAADERLRLRGGAILHKYPPVGGPEWRQFTAAEYHAMADAGILAPDERVQLIAGEVVVMSPMGSRHAAAITLTAEAFYASGQLIGHAVIWVQCPLVIPEVSEPQPDLALLVRRTNGYALAHPRPADVLLLVEVADSTLIYDRRVKLPLYAAAGIPETWLMNLRDDVIESHTDPSPDGYRTVRIYSPGDTITPTAFPETSIVVSQVIPARE